MVPLGSSSSYYARPVPMNGNDCRTGWMNDWMDSPFWLKPSMLRSIQVRTNEWGSMQDCNEMGRSRKSPSLKSTWRQLICVARSLVVISIHSPHFSRQDCMSIRTKKGNFQLVLVSFKRHECDASLLLSKPMHCSQAESQETQSPICFALLSPCQPPRYHHPRVACVKGKDEIMAPHPFHFASTQHHLLEQVVYLYSSHSHSLPAVDIPLCMSSILCCLVYRLGLIYIYVASLSFHSYYPPCRVVVRNTTEIILWRKMENKQHYLPHHSARAEWTKESDDDQSSRRGCKIIIILGMDIGMGRQLGVGDTRRIIISIIAILHFNSNNFNNNNNSYTTRRRNKGDWLKNSHARKKVCAKCTRVHPTTNREGDWDERLR